VGIDPEVAERLSIDPAAGIAGQVFTTGNTVVARAVNNEVESSRHYASDAFLSTPLLSTYINSRETRLGVLNVTDKPDGQPFTLDEIEALCSIAVSAAIALHNAEHETMLKRSIRALLLTVGRLSEYRDEETGLHLERVRDYAKVVARRLGRNPKFAQTVTREFIEDLHQAAPMHDVGKVAIPDEILNKPGRLTHEEHQIMKTHTTIGRHTLNLAMEETGPSPLLRMCVDIAYGHHERWDGKGYPRGLAGERIPLSARIIGLVDAYDAITSQRCYKAAVPHEQAVAIIRSEAGKHFDPDVVAAFLEVADEFNHIRLAKADDALGPLAAAAPLH
jgi:response regulator RpfG family c-di-GMP phosphodiesterase